MTYFQLTAFSSLSVMSVILVNLLRNVITRQHIIAMSVNMQVFPWVPTVDGNFLIDTPYNMLKAGRFQKKDALLGVNRDEGTFWILFALPGFTKDGPSPQNLSMFNSGVDIIAWDLTADQVRLVTDRKCYVAELRPALKF